MLVGRHHITWYLALNRLELVYNDSVNRSNDLSPYKVMHNHNPRATIDLSLIPPLYSTSKSTESSACNMSELHTKQPHLCKSRYKFIAFTHKRFKKFNFGDYIMVGMHLEHFSKETFKKLQARGTRPFEILFRVGENRFFIDIPND